MADYKNELFGTEYYVRNIQCPREGKQDCLHTVQQLVELAFTARDHGLLAMETLLEDTFYFSDPFLRKAVSLTIEIANPDNIRRVLYNTILSSNINGGRRFLGSIIIVEAMIAIGQREDIDYIFTYLVPSFFGIDFEQMAVRVYKDYKRSLFEASEQTERPESEGGRVLDEVNFTEKRAVNI